MPPARPPRGPRRGIARAGAGHRASAARDAARRLGLGFFIRSRPPKQPFSQRMSAEGCSGCGGASKIVSPPGISTGEPRRVANSPNGSDQADDPGRGEHPFHAGKDRAPSRGWSTGLTVALTKENESYRPAPVLQFSSIRRCGRASLLPHPLQANALPQGYRVHRTGHHRIRR